MKLTSTLLGFPFAGKLVPSLALALLLSLPAPSPGAADGYRLGPSDVLRLKVLVWRPSEDTIQELAGLGDQFTVMVDGSISMPFVGPVQAEGATPTELSQLVSEQLFLRLGLDSRPDVSIEVLSYRPVYILGLVGSPGEYEYRPGLTVVQALALAGGLGAYAGDAGGQTRQLVQQQGAFELLTLEEQGLLAQRARLQAEYAAASDIVFPGSLMHHTRENAEVQVIIDQETAIFEARRSALSTQVQQLEQLRLSQTGEWDSLSTRLALIERQMASIREEFEALSDRVIRSVDVVSREASLERTLLRAQSDRLDVETSLLRVEQEINRVELTIIERQTAYREDAAVALRRTEDALLQIAQRKTTQSQLLFLSDGITSRSAFSDEDDVGDVRPSFLLTRSVNGEAVTVDATASTRLLPGDTLTVRFPTRSAGSDNPT